MNSGECAPAKCMPEPVRNPQVQEELNILSDLIAHINDLSYNLKDRLKSVLVEENKSDKEVKDDKQLVDLAHVVRCKRHDLSLVRETLQYIINNIEL